MNDQTDAPCGLDERCEPTCDDLDAMAAWSWAGYRAQLAEFGSVESGERVYPDDCS